MSSNKPAIIIIAGAFTTPESYGKLTSALQSYGYEVHVPRLPTNSEARPTNAGLGEDTGFIRSYVDGLVTAGHRVVAIGHSYGGQVMTNALHGLGLEARSSQGLEGGVCSLVYMTGFALPEGKSTFEKLAEFGAVGEDVPLVFDMAEDESMVLKDPNAFLGLREPGIEEAEIEAYIQTSSRWNGKAMTQPLEKEAWREIPVAYIHTTKDAAIPLAAQQSMVEALEMAGRKVQTFTLETAHCPHFTATDGVVGAINKIISSDGSA
ncbi:Alpha/beta hydrolase fold-1 [Diaporthe sp. PMI_573]|nr:Alpha/beta hydrolase fold-1 [Diaporthaceae sp. PMI_573]